MARLPHAARLQAGGTACRKTRGRPMEGSKSALRQVCRGGSRRVLAASCFTSEPELIPKKRPNPAHRKQARQSKLPGNFAWLEGENRALLSLPEIERK